MATHATHIILTDAIYEDFFSDCSKKEFILGTLLPDIRYLDKTISREKYHIKNIGLENVLSEKDCFKKGIYFHSLVDQVRDDFYISRGVYTFGGDEDFIIALKLFEDQYLYTKIKNRDNYIQLFDDIPYKKIPDIKKECVDERYMMIKKGIIKKPNDSVRKEFMKKIGLSEEYINKINNIITKIKEDEKLLRIVDELYDSFKELIQN